MIRKTLIISAVILGLLAEVAAVQAKVAPLSSLESKSVVRIEVLKNKIDRDPVQQGAGYMLDYKGCILTSGHILYNNDNPSQVYKVFKVWVYDNIRRLPTKHYFADLKYLDIGRDVGILCLQNTGGQFFYPFPLYADSGYQNLSIGEEVRALGFPSIGGKTPTYSYGHVVGFWEQPNLQEFLQISRFEDKQMYLIKTDAVTGPGGSGGPVLDKDNHVLGITFAASLSPGGISFLLSSKTINISLKRYQAENMVLGCVKEDDLYVRDGKQYYDSECLLGRDKNMEHIVDLNYRSRCSHGKHTFNLYQAAAYIVAGKSDVDHLWQYLTMLCPVLDSVSVPKSGSEQSKVRIMSAEEFAYGKPRVDNLSVETKSSVELKQKLEKIMGKGKLRVSRENWPTLVNSYLYGGYTVQAIYKSIVFGGYTVHPSIPFIQWKNSRDYKEHINKSN